VIEEGAYRGGERRIGAAHDTPAATASPSDIRSLPDRPLP
jgi:hypothetical protein